MKNFYRLFSALALILGLSSCDSFLTTVPNYNQKPGTEPDPDPIEYEAGWPSNYDGVMLQGFYWDSYTDTQWQYLESQASDIAPYFSLIWVPNSGYCGGGNSMGYLPLYFFNQKSSFGSEAQLRSMINTYKSKGTGIIADVVINHHNTASGWFDFPEETYGGVTYQLKSTDVVSDDDGGKAATAAASAGVQLSSNKDTGEGWDGCRDIDHLSQNVQKYVLAYLDFLKNSIGYAGFRYDMVKGYSASFTGYYNSSIKPQFSVGEYWDGNASVVESWMEGTKVNGQIQSGAFDFCFRYTCRDASNGMWGKLLNQTSASNTTGYNRYAVTFVENHDTEYRSASEQQDPIRKDTLAVNAWLLANPGTPCVFYKHWQEYKKEIKEMIEARKLVGITNTSTYSNITNTGFNDYAARDVKGTNGTLRVVVGTKAESYAVPAGYTEILSGYHYRYFVSSDCNISTWAATLARIQEEEYTEPFTPHKATVYVCADFTPIYFYAWDSNSTLLGSWPGSLMSETVSKGGKNWYYKSFDINTQKYYFNIIFNQGNGKPQTADIGHINSDKYFIATLSGSNINYTDVTSTYLE